MRNIVLRELRKANVDIENSLKIISRGSACLDVIKHTTKARSRLTLAKKLLSIYHLKFCVIQPEKFAEEVVKTYRYQD